MKLSTLILLLFLASCATLKPTEKNALLYPPVEREFRAAWVATVANINWPSEPGLSVEKQQAEAIFLLDLLQSHNFNAVVFQVRPHADALYKSELEPWSYYLTGEQGTAPAPFYDPLEFWIIEAHRRGLELHAWLNPYRAHHPKGGEVTSASIVSTQPELVVQLKQGYHWMDPSLKGTQDHSYNVVMDIVNRYKVDGIHFDDYFYPYPSYNDNEDFPDSTSWATYTGKLSRGDWRRKSVNDFIKRVYNGIKKEKPHVKFGLSPFGIWKPNYPTSIKGFDQKEKLYADAKLWLNKGWIDYFAPQLYWPVNQVPQSYPVLLGWWKGENTKGRHLWPGMSIGRFQGEKAIDETFNQVMISRGMLPKSPGHIHWSIAPLVRDSILADTLSKTLYKNQALIPASPWLGKQKLKAPLVQANVKNNSYTISWSQSPNQEPAFLWVVRSQYGDRWEYQVVNGLESAIFLDENVNGATLTSVLISAVGKYGNEGEAGSWKK